MSDSIFFKCSIVTVVNLTMRPCHCSTQSLEIFIREFTKLHIARPRQSVVCVSSRRTIYTQTLWRQLEPSAPTHIDDSFVPFELPQLLSTSSQPTPSSKTEARSPHHVDRISEEGATGTEARKPAQEAGEWQAEIQVVPNSSMITSPVHRASQQSVDAVRLDGVHVEEADVALPVPVIGNIIPEVLNARPRGRSNSPEMKALRKQRFMQARAGARAQGIPVTTPPKPEDSAKPEAPKSKRPRTAKQQRGERETASENPVEDVLQKISAMEGPPLNLGHARRPPITREVTTATTHKDKGDKNSSPNKSTTKPPTTIKPLKKSLDPHNDKETWMIQKAALSQKFAGAGWQPRKRLSPDTLSGIRALHAADPTTHTTASLAAHFCITPEAIRRILKSRWQPSDEEADARVRRWERRGLRNWTEMAALGQKPPRKWRDLGVPNPVAEAKEKRLNWERKVQQKQIWKRRVAQYTARGHRSAGQTTEGDGRAGASSSLASRIT